MGSSGKQIRCFLLLLMALALAGCGSSKEMEKKEHADPYDPQIVVQGFRVQLFDTPEIDVANKKKAQAEAAFPDEWFYVVYDQPTYKLRGGNFVNRAGADAFAKYLTGKGFPDAWIVPEKVVKNPQPRTQAQSGNHK